MGLSRAIRQEIDAITEEMVKPLRFRLRIPGKRGNYFRVFIFATREIMHAFFKEQGKIRRLTPEVRGYNFDAIASSWRRAYRTTAGRLVPTRERGQALFHDQRFGGGIVAHEMTHLAVQECIRRRVKPYSHRGEERLAYLVGSFCSQFWDRYYRARPMREPHAGRKR